MMDLNGLNDVCQWDSRGIYFEVVTNIGVGVF